MDPVSPRVDCTAHPLACSSPLGWIVGATAIALGAFCAFAAFTAPVLFGPLVAFVIGAERLLRATQARNPTFGAAWSLLAAAWFGSMACMLHTPLLGKASSDSCVATLAALLILNAACWTWSRVRSSATWHYEVAPVWLGTGGALMLLYGGPSSVLSRVAATAAISLALIGYEWIAAMVLRTTTGATAHPRRNTDCAEPPTWAGALEPRLH